jgi:AraC-like DNA-binding protein
MKPQYERVTLAEGCSVRVYHRRIERIPFEWHHHPEYELTLTMNSHGRRFIGDHIADYAGDDLVLVPPDLPHTWASTESIDAREPQVAIVIWFSGDWARRVADCCPEFASLRKLLRRSAPGLHFGAAATAALRARVPALLDASPRARLLAVLDALAELAEADAEPLATPSAHLPATGRRGTLASRTTARAPHDRISPQGEQHADTTRPGTAPEAERLNRVFDLLDRRFHEPLKIADLCAVANMSERTLHRQFLRHAGESVGRYLTRLRIGYAARQLTDTDWPISLIASKSGYPSLANFNRQFLAARGMTPGEHRRIFEAQGHMAGHPALDVRPPSLERPASRRRPTARPKRVRSDEDPA